MIRHGYTQQYSNPGDPHSGVGADALAVSGIKRPGHTSVGTGTL